MNRRRSLLILLTLALTVMSACSSKQVRISSKPTGAEVKTLDGDVLGQTSLELDSTMQSKLENGDRLYILINHNQYMPMTVILEPKAGDDHEVRLIPLNDEYFEKSFKNHFGAQTNNISKQVLKIQSQIVARRYDDAGKLLADLQKNYPSLAISYLLAANLAILQGRKNDVLENLYKARAIDPSDAEVDRLIKLNGGQPARTLSASPTANASPTPDAEVKNP